MKLFLMLMMLIYTDLEIWPKLQVYMELVLQEAQIAQDIFLICSCELATSNFSRSHVMMKLQISSWSFAGSLEIRDWHE
jgi:hypothetical protein